MNRDHRNDRKYDDSDFDRMRKPAPRHDDDEIMNNQFEIRGDRGGSQQASEYRTLCISNLNPRVPDHVVSQALYEEFAKFGDFNVKIVHQGDHRIAYVNFRFSDDARAAKHSRRPGAFILFDMPVRVDSVIHNQRRPNTEGFNNRDSSYSGRGGMSPGQNQGNRRQFNREDREYYDQYDNFREFRFPHHLHHIAPEDDQMATRTLFVGNLDNNIFEEDLRDVFCNFGVVEEIDIKYPTKQGYSGNAYAFVKFINLDMAHRAKVEMSGQLIGNHQCKIGYGKVSATNCVWVGGLGPWVTPEQLEQEFDRFGAIRHIEWQQSKNYAYIVYDNTDAAQAASSEMRGVPLGGPEHRLRVDFADESHIGQDFGPPVPMPVLNQNRNQTNESRGFSNNEWKNQERRDSRGIERGDERKTDRDRRSDDVNGNGRQSRDFNSDRHPVRTDADKQRSYSPPVKRRRSSCEQRPSNFEQREDKDHGLMNLGNAGHVDNVTDLCKCLPVVWNGALVLKNSAFAARLHLVSGDVHLVDTLMRDTTTTEMSWLKITQRLRLDPPKLEEVGRRVSTAGPGGHAVLLAQPGSSQALDDASSGRNVQQRPLKNLMSYLKQKEAAGVIALPPVPGKDRENVGVLHAFPPCPFGNEYLTRRAPKLNLDAVKDEYLVMVVVKGAPLP